MIDAALLPTVPANGGRGIAHMLAIMELPGVIKNPRSSKLIGAGRHSLLRLPGSIRKTANFLHASESRHPAFLRGRKKWTSGKTLRADCFATRTPKIERTTQNVHDETVVNLRLESSTQKNSCGFLETAKNFIIRMKQSKGLVEGNGER